MLDFIVGNWILLLVPVGTVLVVVPAFIYRYFIEPRLRDRVKETEEDFRI